MPENISEFRVADFEYRANENRQDGDALGTITGTVITYGDRATLPWGPRSSRLGLSANATARTSSPTGSMNGRNPWRAAPTSVSPMTRPPCGPNSTCPTICMGNW